MRRIHLPAELRQAMNEVRSSGARVGFVPTMGALHEGHLSLVDEARRRADHVVVSVFVNPLQFGPSEDLAKYPRTLEADAALCESRGVATLFAPSPADMYPPGFSTSVDVSGVTEVLEGAHRPGHFRGVSTVVTRLFGLVGPCAAVFGRKDYQQLKVIETMTRDLALPVDVVGMPTSRERDGLARSSRNRYLSDEQRAKATAIAAGIRSAAARYASGERDPAVLEHAAREPVAEAFDAVDYVRVVNAESLLPVLRHDEPMAVLFAARIGGTRLIDNHAFGVDPLP